MSGGYGFDRSKFNRATQAYRQVGSAFKPIVYTAAIDRGYTPVTVLSDTPATFSGGAGQPAYSPMNYDKKFEGPITLRHALEESRNVPAVRVMEQLGPKQVIAYARRLGLESPLPPYLAVALGAAEATLMEMTSAYSVFPNQGVRLRPLGAQGHRPGRQRPRGKPPEPKDAIRADTAFVMTRTCCRASCSADRGEGGCPELADRRQDRNDRRLHRRVVHRVRSRHHDRGLGRLRPEADTGSRRDRRGNRASDLDRHHEAYIGDRKDRRSSSRPVTSCSCRSIGSLVSCPQTARRAPSRKPSSRARSPGRDSDENG